MQTSISKTRQTFLLQLREMEGIQQVLSGFDDPKMNFLKQHIDQVVIHLNIIVKNIEKLETADNKFWNALN